MNAKFTPGPWVAVIYGGWDAMRVMSSDRGQLALVQHPRDCDSPAEGEANAHLMSAAPEMYAEIQANCHKLLAFGLCDQEECADCSTSNLLRKARGEA